MVILVLFFVWALTGGLFIMLGCPDVLAVVLGLAGPVGLIWLCAHAHDPAGDVIQQGHENFRQMQAEKAAMWAEQARREDCYYSGGSICAPMRDYWSDGSIKRDRWTGKTFPKGQYFLNSRGHNSALPHVPPNAKRCPD